MVLSPTRSKAYQRELYGWLISLGCNGGTPFYLNRQERVNTILSFLGRGLSGMAKAQRTGKSLQKTAAAESARSRVGRARHSVRASQGGTDHLITDD